MARGGYENAGIMIGILFAVDIVNYIAGYMLPGSTVRIAQTVVDFGYLTALGNFSLLVAGATVFTLLGFIGLMPITLAFVIALFLLPGILLAFYISSFGLPIVFTIPIIIAVALNCYTGIVQYTARSDI